MYNVWMYVGIIIVLCKICFFIHRRKQLRYQNCNISYRILKNWSSGPLNGCTGVDHLSVNSFFTILIFNDTECLIGIESQNLIPCLRINTDMFLCVSLIWRNQLDFKLTLIIGKRVWLISLFHRKLLFLTYNTNYPVISNSSVQKYNGPRDIFIIEIYTKLKFSIASLIVEGYQMLRCKMYNIFAIFVFWFRKALHTIYFSIHRSKYRVLWSREYRVICKTNHLINCEWKF